MSNYKRKLPAARSQEGGFMKFTDKQLAVYYYLITKALYNGEKREDHYFIYKEDLCYATMGRQLNIKATKTIKTAMDKLELGGYLCITNDIIYLPVKDYYTYMGVRLIRLLLAYSSEVGAEIILFYSILKRFYELNKKNNKKTTFNTKLMMRLLGHSTTDTHTYRRYRLYIALLEGLKLIEVTTQIKRSRGGEYCEFLLWNIKQDVEESFDMENEELPEIDKEILEELNKSIDFEAD